MLKGQNLKKIIQWHWHFVSAHKPWKGKQNEIRFMLKIKILLRSTKPPLSFLLHILKFDLISLSTGVHYSPYPKASAPNFSSAQENWVKNKEDKVINHDNLTPNVHSNIRPTVVDSSPFIRPIADYFNNVSRRFFTKSV